MAAMGLTLPPSFTERAIIWNTPPPRASVRGSTTLSAHCRCRRCRDASSWCRRRGRTRRRWCSRIDLVGDDGPALNEEVGRKGDHYAVGGLRLNVPRARLRGILIHSSPFPLCVLAQHSTGGNVNGPHGPSPRWLSSEELQGNEAIPRRPGRERPTRYGSCVLRQRAQQRRRAQASVPPQGRLSDTQAVSGANTAECKAFTAVSAAVIHV